jgi:transcription initiation factor TFIIIB Brf1 subunit/transcription initiation factor TFIIB
VHACREPGVQLLDPGLSKPSATATPVRLADSLALAKLEGKTPRGACAGVLAVAARTCGVETAKKAIADACMVSVGTVEKMAKLVTPGT